MGVTSPMGYPEKWETQARRAKGKGKPHHQECAIGKKIGKIKNKKIAQAVGMEGATGGMLRLSR
jgi:hypothetical protein